MASRLAVLVDAGYLLSQTIQILSQKNSRSRKDLVMHNPCGLINLIVDKAKTTLNNENLLRVYWYDGVKDSLSAEHKAIIAIDDVQLRAGTINGRGEQKGVDSKIVTDLIELATNHAISDALVVTGDGDLAIGIEIAQRRGVRVAVLGVEEQSVKVMHSQSPEVTSIADRVISIGNDEISKFFTYSPKDELTKSTNPKVETKIEVAQLCTVDSIVKQFISSQNPKISKTVIDSFGRIETAIDRLLLYFVFESLNQGRLTNQQKIEIRNSFKRQI